MFNESLLIQIQKDQIELLLLIHIIISLALSLFLVRYLKDRFPEDKNRAILFLFLFQVALPIVGYFASIWLVYYLNNTHYKDELQGKQIINLEEFENSFIKIERAFGEGSMLELMNNDYVPTQTKIKALVAISENISKQNINIIKQTLESRDDEVRLYSFAILDKVEHDLNLQIYGYLEEYKRSDDSKQKAKYAKELAFLYWEMIYFQLLEEGLKEFFLHEVMKYLAIAQEYLTDDVEICILQGRVYMMNGELEKAIAKFNLANEKYPNKLPFIMPYLAEINFNLGNYDVVKSIMNSADGLALNATLHPIVNQWKSSQ